MKKKSTFSLRYRKGSTLHLPITLNVVLISLNILLMVFWIVILARESAITSLTLGTVLFALILVGLSFYLFLTIKEVRLRKQQSNFVDSVTHELKTPIASLRLYLETLQMRELEPERRDEFYKTMGSELERLDHLINQLLEVAGLDAIGQHYEPEEIELLPFLQKSAGIAAAHHKQNLEEVFSFEGPSVVLNTRRLILEMIFGNLLDNAIKYGGDPPRVKVEILIRPRGRIVTRVIDNGPGVPHELRAKIFRIFFRGGDELTRKQKGTGLGLYIVKTLVNLLKGRVTVHHHLPTGGSVFEVDLPGRAG
ncbi:Sensor protein kinase WalK [Polystyrenella longa]|uniref:histidine kinase n=1 Tax=Polystyrenella longa TaxID=2528007 RepID=A0A518CIN9_9PLAN|nr:HAMP domain-containing sensor histidine kinase [Polystyrenella longa]QDU79098.1 Sensor protein kinase WalK [Polystyrenella longa]